MSYKEEQGLDKQFNAEEIEKTLRRLLERE